jgi:hypothetical protein
MTRKSDSVLHRGGLLAAAAAIAATFPAPAFAGDRHGYDHGYYGSRYDRSYSYDRNRYRRHGRGHLSGGEAALIAAGIIGGVILIDKALDNRDSRGRYDDRYRRYDDRDRRGGDDYYYRRDDRYDDRYSDSAFEERRFDDERDEDWGYRSVGSADDRRSDDLDDILLGDDGARPGPAYADIAFRECVAETRGAAGAGGLLVAMPGAPARIEELADGSLRMSASFRASNARGDEWTRRFVCEADEDGVKLLRID